MMKLLYSVFSYKRKSCRTSSPSRVQTGTALITKILDLADNWLMLERVELGVLVTNPRAQALCERHGFVVEGKKIGSVRSAGQYVDEVMMARLRLTGLIDPVKK